MSLIDLYIKDKGLNEVRRIGDDCHDMLTIKDGKLHYQNLQNGGGCTLGEEAKDWYEFVDNTDDYGYNCDPRDSEVQSSKLKICDYYYKGYCSKYDDGCFHQCLNENLYGERIKE